MGSGFEPRWQVIGKNDQFARRYYHNNIDIIVITLEALGILLLFRLDRKKGVDCRKGGARANNYKFTLGPGILPPSKFRVLR